MNRDEVYQELVAIYGDLEAELAERSPRCELSGRCCKFKEFGHQLWTSRLELDYLLKHHIPPTGTPEGVCPFLRDGLCSVRDHRMLGCRVYFCDPSYEAEMGGVYEKYHRRIRDLHKRADVSYEYLEFSKVSESTQVQDGD